MALLKQGQQLVETSQEELQKQTGLPAVSPMGAKVAGATPDSAKMMGTPAQKQAAQAAPDTQTTLKQAQRVSPPSPDKIQQQATQQAQMKVDRLKQLGSLRAQIETMVQSRMAALSTQAAPQQLQVNANALTAIPEQNRAQAQQLLQDYASASDANVKQQKLAALSQLMGGVVTAEQVQGYFTQAPAQLAQEAQAVMPTTITIGSLQDAGQAAWLNLPQTAQDLGVSEEQLRAFTPEQLQTAIQTAESQEFNRVQNLQAELQTAVGARRQSIINELRGLGQVGATGVEAQFDTLQQAVDAGDTVVVLGQPVPVSELLASDFMSDKIALAATDEKAFAELAKTSPSLADWITTHKQALTDLATGMRQNVREFGDIQQQASQLTSGAQGGVITALFGQQPQYLTSAQLTNLQNQIAASPVMQAMQSDPTLKAAIDKDVNIATQLKDKTADQIAALSEASKTLQTNPDVADIFGLTPGAFVTDPSVTQNIMDTVSTVSAFKDDVARSYVVDMLKDKTIDLATAQALVDHPEEVENVKTEADLMKAYEPIKNDYNKLEQWIFGKPENEINDQLSKLAAMAPYDEKANQLLTIFNNIIGDNKQLDASDLGRLQAAVASSGLSSVISGGATIKDKMASLMSGLNEATAYAPSAELDTMRNILADNKVDYQDISNLTATQLTRLMNNSYFRAHYPDQVKYLQTVSTLKTGFNDRPELIKFVDAATGKLRPASLGNIANSLSIDEMDKLSKYSDVFSSADDRAKFIDKLNNKASTEIAKNAKAAGVDIIGADRASIKGDKAVSDWAPMADHYKPGAVYNQSDFTFVNKVSSDLNAAKTALQSEYDGMAKMLDVYADSPVMTKIITSKLKDIKGKLNIYNQMKVPQLKYRKDHLGYSVV